MDLFNNFEKDYRDSHYSRYPRSLVMRNIIFSVLFALLVLAIIRVAFM